MEAVNFAFQQEMPVNCELKKVSETLKRVQMNESLVDQKKKKKMKFMQRQIELLGHTEFCMADYCFALENFPRCRYEQLQDFLVLPNKRKIQAIISTVDVKAFDSITPQQKYCFLLIDEVKIRPIVAYSGGVLNGMAKNNNNYKASSMLGIMLKCLHGGPSIMVSVTPVHKLNGCYQFEKVKQATALVEQSGGTVLGSITDNHKVNQKYGTFFDRRNTDDFEAIHPMFPERPWFLLFDTVHLFKCLRNNWVSEKTQQLTFDNEIVGNFADIKDLYHDEKGSILKTTPLVSAAVHPSRLQLQNVQHVVKVFNDKVVTALKVKNKHGTASLVQQVLSWWKAINVSTPGDEQRFNDPDRAMQTKNSSNLQSFVELFSITASGHGPNRQRAMTHDTKKALVQTMNGLIAVCNYLYDQGFNYVLLGSIQSDKIEGEFSVYRSSTGSNSFMICGDVEASFRKRLAKFSASFLQKAELGSAPATQHTCLQTTIDDAQAMENSSTAELTAFEQYSTAYVAGWLEKKCHDLSFLEEEPRISGNVSVFIQELSRGSLCIPHVPTYDFVSSGLSFIEEVQYKVCCRKRLMDNLNELNSYFEFGPYPESFVKRMANVLLNGLHKMERDTEANAVRYNTAIKKARLS